MPEGRPRPLTVAERAIVKRCARFWHRRKWQVHALTVKPTHVHVVATMLPARPEQYFSFSEVLHSVKRVSSRAINKLRLRRGTLWEEESYDHLIRSEREFEQAWNYVLRNAAEEVPGGDAYGYDGFWCESMEGPLLPPSEGPPPLAKRPVSPRVEGFVMRERKLPHWEQAGASYHLVFCLLGHQPREQWPWPEPPRPRSRGSVPV